MEIIKSKYDIGDKFWIMYGNKPMQVEIEQIAMFKTIPIYPPHNIKESIIYALGVLTNNCHNTRYHTVLNNYTEEKIEKECFKTKEELIKNLY